MKTRAIFVAVALATALSLPAWSQRGGGASSAGPPDSGSTDAGTGHGFADFLPGSGTPGSPGRGGAATPAVRKPKSPAETQALVAINGILGGADATPEQLDAALAAFTAKYPKSDFIGEIHELGVQFDARHNDFPGVLQNGELALKADPQNLYVLSTLGLLLPDHIGPTDANREQLLKQAEEYNKKTLSAADAMQIDAGRGATLAGHHVSADQAKQVKVGLQAGARRSLGEIAIQRAKYPEALQELNKALALETGDAGRAADDYFIGQAQAGANNNAAADAAFAQATRLAGGNAELLQRIADAQAKLPAH